MKAKHAKELMGWDASRSIRQAQRELAEYVRQERRRAEVDRKEGEVTLDVPVMLFETPAGQWRIETIGDAFAGQNGNFSVTERTEPLAMAEFRFKLRNELIQARWCNPTDAQRYAASAKITVHGRVPFQRIQVGSGG